MRYSVIFPYLTLATAESVIVLLHFLNTVDRIALLIQRVVLQRVIPSNERDCLEDSLNEDEDEEEEEEEEKEEWQLSLYGDSEVICQGGIIWWFPHTKFGGGSTVVLLVGEIRLFCIRLYLTLIRQSPWTDGTDQRLLA